MSLIAFQAQNHPQQTRIRGADDSINDRGTNPELWAEIEGRFGIFDLDVAAAPHNAKCARFYTREQDGLTLPWDGERVWCNPPFSKSGERDLGDWVRKARAEWLERRNQIVMLLPANRTEQGWWQREVEPYRDRADDLRLEFLPGRIRFILPGKAAVGPNERPPFGCCLLIWPLAAPGANVGGGE